MFRLSEPSCVLGQHFTKSPDWKAHARARTTRPGHKGRNSGQANLSAVGRFLRHEETLKLRYYFLRRFTLFSHRLGAHCVRCKRKRSYAGLLPVAYSEEKLDFLRNLCGCALCFVRYSRRADGFLPSSDATFLDEISFIFLHRYMDTAWSCED